MRGRGWLLAKTNVHWRGGGGGARKRTSASKGRVGLKTREPWANVLFECPPATLLKTLFHGCFSHFLNCTNGTRLCKWYTHTHSVHGLTSLNPCIAGVGQESLSIWLYYSSLFIPVPNVCNTETKESDFWLDIL